MGKPKLSEGSRCGARANVPVPPLVVEAIISALTRPAAQSLATVTAMGQLAKAIKVAGAEPTPAMLGWLEGNGWYWDEV